MIPVIDPWDFHLYQPPEDSHKGQNGRLLVIGGSKLFHSSIFWAADVASRIVDLVHFTSPANENNDLVRKKIKEHFWSGIVVDWGDAERYIEEDDCVSIGPGMVREPVARDSTIRVSRVGRRSTSGLNETPAKAFRLPLRLEGNGVSVPSKQNHLVALGQLGREDNTGRIVDDLLRKYPSKRWVVDGGALQEVDPNLLMEMMIITPHHGELLRLVRKIDEKIATSLSRYLG